MTLTDKQFQNLLGALVFGALAVGYAVAGLDARRRGRISLRFSVVTRAEDPHGFARLLVIRTLLVVGLAALALWFAWDAR